MKNKRLHKSTIERYIKGMCRAVHISPNADSIDSVAQILYDLNNIRFRKKSDEATQGHQYSIFAVRRSWSSDRDVFSLHYVKGGVVKDVWFPPWFMVAVIKIPGLQIPLATKNTTQLYLSRFKSSSLPGSRVEDSTRWIFRLIERMGGSTQYHVGLL